MSADDEGLVVDLTNVPIATRPALLERLRTPVDRRDVRKLIACVKPVTCACRKGIRFDEDIKHDLETVQDLSIPIRSEGVSSIITCDSQCPSAAK
jgi:hypothetical protein